MPNKVVEELGYTEPAHPHDPHEDYKELLEYLDVLMRRGRLHMQVMTNGKIVVFDDEIGAMGKDLIQAARSLRAHILNNVADKFK